MVFDPAVPPILRKLCEQVAQALGPIFPKEKNILHVNEATMGGPLGVTTVSMNPVRADVMIDLDLHRNETSTPQQLAGHLAATITHEMVLHARRHLEIAQSGEPKENDFMQHKRIHHPESRGEYHEAIVKAEAIFDHPDTLEELAHLHYSFYDDVDSHVSEHFKAGKLSASEADERMQWATSCVDKALSAEGRVNPRKTAV